MPEPVCKSQEGGGYDVVFALVAFNCTKYSRVRSQVRGKLSSNGVSQAKVAKRSEK